jgi:hypothetical protein
VTKSATDVFGTNTGAAIAFLISMFSYERISAITSSLVNRALNVPAAAPDETNDLVVKLPGVDQTTAYIFASEGMTTVAELASADPIRVSLRTGLPFDQVISLVDSAILWRYVNTKLLILREYGWAGASNVLYYKETLQAYNTAKAKADAAKTVLEDAQNALTRAEEDLTTAETNLAAAQETDPNYAHLKDAVTQAKTKREDCEQTIKTTRKNVECTGNALSQAREPLVDQSPDGMRKLLEDMATATKTLTVAGLQDITEQICVDSYAKFIRRLMTTT